MNPTPDPSPPSNPNLTPSEKADIIARALRGEATADDTRRYIESIRAGFLALPTARSAKPKAAAKPEVAVKHSVDYF